MAMEQPQLRLTTDLPQEKPVKRGKSLSRTLSSAFRKTSKSRPTSPSALPTPPTPHVPAEFRPQTAGARTPSSPAFELILNDKKHENDDVGEGAIGLGQEAHGSPEPGAQVQRRKSLRHHSIVHDRQPSWTSGDDNSRPHTAGVIEHVMEERQSEEVLSAEKKLKPKKSLRISSGKLSNKDRSTSATMPLPQSSPTSPIPRPATFGASLPTPSPSNGRAMRSSSGDSQQKVYTNPFDVPPSPRLPWQTQHSSEESRSSLRSAVTATSSRTNTTRNSVLTKETAMTDLTFETSLRPESKEERKSEEGLTVDEAIDMYAAGFTDDPVEGSEEQTQSQAEEERRRSAKIAEAIGDEVGPSDLYTSPESSARPSTSGSSRSKSTRSRSFSQGTLTHGTTFPYGPSRDQYGFLKYNHYITRSTYDAWFADYYPSQVRRCYKWVTFLKESKLPTENPVKFPPRSLKTQRYIRKGIPPAWRGAAWFHYANGDKYVARHPQFYNNAVILSDQKLPENDKEAIERDLHRTFPDNIRFKPEPGTVDKEDTELLGALRRVLRAFALEHPAIGYCQSLNFIAALLLLFMSEEKAYWMLHIITTLYLPGTHDISLEGANVDLWVLAVALKQNHPQVWAKVGGKGLTDDDGKKSRLPPISLCTTSWFMGLFIGTLPIESVLRVWDLLFYDGPKTLFRAALAIFKIGEPEIRSVIDSMELFQLVQSIPRCMIDATTFMDMQCKPSTKNGVGGDFVERMRGERRIFLAKQRAKNAARSPTVIAKPAEPGANPDERPKLERKKSIWSRKKVVDNNKDNDMRTDNNSVPPPPVT